MKTAYHDGSHNEHFIERYIKKAWVEDNWKTVAWDRLLQGKSSTRHGIV